MPQLPSINDCTACGACIDVCNHNAINLIEDKNCFYNISINQEKCVECKICESRCHILNQDKLERHDPASQPLAGWSTNLEIIKKSATGGIFAQIAYDFLEDADTYVYGASLQKDSSVKHIEISERKDLYKLQNSKYQQSQSVGIFKQVKNRLKEGRRVLFSGVPCQVAALYAYLNYNEKLLERLYTIEVICHGVPTNALHRLGLKYNNAKRLVAYRTKESTGWCFGGNNRVVYEMPNGATKAMANTMRDFLFRAYLSFSFSRKNCYKCKYSTLKRVSDITIGDFWGFERSANYAQYGNFMGTSIILVNSSKGKRMIEESEHLHTVEASWKEILPLNQNLYMPTNRYIFNGYDKVHKLLKLPSSIRKVIFMNGFTNRIPNKIYMAIFNILTKNEQERKENEVQKELEEALIYLKTKE